jgi:rfaE bifunctional protein kinase chain/domain
MTTAEILAEFPKLRTLVVGDIALDRWCRYDPRLADPSRETGIPRIGVVSTETTAGAAGTVANNVEALGASTAVLGAIGDDGFGVELSRALDRGGIGNQLLVRSSEIATFTYTKLINTRTGEEDLPRVDFVNTRPIPEELDGELVRRFEEAAADYDVVLVSDQAETDHGGVVTPAMRAAIARLAAAHPETVIWVDSRMRAEHFRGVIVKPNLEEAEAASRRALGRVDFCTLRRHLQAKLLVVTHGPDGALLVEESGSRWAPGRRVERPVDICGAGDSFSAGAALTLKVTGDAVEAARMGNLVASITIMKKGTGTASPAEVLEADA